MSKEFEVRSTPGDILRMLFRHKKKVLFCIVVTMATTIAAIVYWPRAYVSDASLFVRVGRESVAIDPTATTGDTIAVSTSREVEINNALGVLRSRELAEKVVDQLGPETILGKKSAAPSTLVSRLTGLVPTLDPVPDHENAIRRLQRRLQARSDRNSDIITVSCEAKSAALAQRLVATVVEIYLTEHVRLHRTPKSHPFFAEQADLVEKQLTEARSKLHEAKNKARLLTIDGQRGILHAEMAAVETDLLRAEPMLAASQERATVLRKSLDALPERLMTAEVAGNPNAAADQMRSQLYTLEAREAELASKFEESFPTLIAVRKQIASLKEILAEQNPQRTQSTTAVNPIHQSLTGDVVKEEAAVQSLQAQVQSLHQQQAALSGRFELLNSQEAAITGLEREVDLLQAKHKTYLEKLEQSRIDEALAGQRITNVNILQPASYIQRPASPKKAMMLAVGLVVALMLAFAVAATAERWNRRPRASSRHRRRLIAQETLSSSLPPRRRAVASY